MMRGSGQSAGNLAESRDTPGSRGFTVLSMTRGRKLCDLVGSFPLALPDLILAP
jgi:hypothetical protein